MSRRILVTGATSGIGAATARRLVEDGQQVVALGRSREKLAALDGMETVLCDLAQPDTVEAALDRIRAGGPLDGLVSNAAEVVYETPLRLPVARWRRLLEINLLGSIQLLSGLSDHLADGAQIVWVSSVTSGAAPNPRFAPYALTKAALDDYMSAVRRELLPRGIRVTRIAPGLVDTPIYGKVDGFARTEARIRQALPQWLAADDVAETIHWVLSRPAHVGVVDLTLAPLGQDVA